MREVASTTDLVAKASLLTRLFLLANLSNVSKTACGSEFFDLFLEDVAPLHQCRRILAAQMLVTLQNISGGQLLTKVSRDDCDAEASGRPRSFFIVALVVGVSTDEYDVRAGIPLRYL